MGRAGFTRGQVFAQNLQAGRAVKTLTGTGWQTTSITYSEKMFVVPRVEIAQVAGNSDTTSVPTVTKLVARDVSRSGFNLDLVSSTTGVIYVDWIAYDDSYN